MVMNRRTREFDVGALIIGAAIIVVGGFYFLRNTLGFEMGELNWDAIWPFFVIAIGLSILVRVARHAGRDQAA
jgi:hypothetical protein